MEQDTEQVQCILAHSGECDGITLYDNVTCEHAEVHPNNWPCESTECSRWPDYEGNIICIAVADQASITRR